jgi:uroporphyrin-III C-methyltransferase/precorrin-2 dehydrogenase/sirohydrochlorin ferrochelatase
MDFLPVFLNLQKQQCLVAGEGAMAVQKIELLLSAGASVHLSVQNQLCDTLKELSEKGRIKIIKDKIGEFEVKDYKLIIAASEDLALNTSIVDIANQNNIPVNVVDQPELCSFLFPSIVDRSPLIIAVSSCGKSTTLSRFIRNKVAAFLPEEFSPLAVMLGEFRHKMKPFLLTYEAKKDFWKNMIFSGSVVELFLSGKKDTAREILQEELEKHKKRFNQ